jgi:hypothetical protein
MIDLVGQLLDTTVRQGTPKHAVRPARGPPGQRELESVCEAGLVWSAQRYNTLRT